MAKSAAERAREYRQRKRDAKSVTERHEKQCDVTVGDQHMGMDSNEPKVLGPLDVYSERRWVFLQSRGYEWYADRLGEVKCGVAIKNLGGPGQLFGVTVPGDPGYSEPKGVCRTCGCETQTAAIVKCFACVFKQEAA
jgi:hypothetical protein